MHTVGERISKNVVWDGISETVILSETVNQIFRDEEDYYATPSVISKAGFAVNAVIRSDL